MAISVSQHIHILTEPLAASAAIHSPNLELQIQESPEVNGVLAVMLNSVLCCLRFRMAQVRPPAPWLDLVTS